MSRKLRSSTRNSKTKSPTPDISFLLENDSQQSNSENACLFILKHFKNNSLDSTTCVADKNLDRSKKNSLIQKASVEEIECPVQVSNVKVPHSNELSKKHFCLFCKTLQTKISRHLLGKHKSEKQVKKALKLPSKSKERVKIIEDLRKQGDFMHNTSKEHNSGVLIVSRQQQANRQNSVDDYVCCKNCKGFFSKKTLRIHLNRCGNPEKNSRYNLANGRKLTQYIHQAANFTMKTVIFPIIRNDEVARAIRYDELIIKYGNTLTEKYKLTHQQNMIRSHLRLLGRFLIQIKNLDKKVNEFKDIYKPQLFDSSMKAFRIISNWDEEMLCSRNPGVAQTLTTLIKKCGAIQRSEYNKTQSDDLKKDLENFLLLWECNQKRNEQVKLPTKNDIQKLYLYLKDKIINAINILEKEFSFNAWVELVKSSLILILIFNRRRATEIEHLTISDYKNKGAITNNMGNDMLKKMSNESLTFAKQYCCLNFREKSGRTIRVLLNPLCTKAIDLILMHRSSAGISEKNQFIFSKLPDSKSDEPYYKACIVLKQFSTECGAEMPVSFSGKQVRKHISTYTTFLDIEDTTIDQLANFMEHHTGIDENVYRVSLPVADITRVSALLETAFGGEDEKEESDENDERNNGCPDPELYRDTTDKSSKRTECLSPCGEAKRSKRLESKNYDTPPAARKKRNTSPFGKTKRKRWTEEERKAIHKCFGSLKKLERLPSLHQCAEAIRDHVALKKRTPPQLKSWIDNQRRYILKDNTSDEEEI